MEVVDYRTAKQDNNKIKLKNTIYDQNSMSIIKKVTKSNSHKKNPK